MTVHRVTFNHRAEPVTVKSGTLITEAAKLAGIDIHQPCGGQGRCGRCIVQVTEGKVRLRSSLRLSAEDLSLGYCLACQAVIEGDISVLIPEQERIERRLVTDRTAVEVEPPPTYAPNQQTLKRYFLTLEPPDYEDQTDDLSRLLTQLRVDLGFEEVEIPITLLKKIGTVLREGNWRVTIFLDVVPCRNGVPHVRMVEIFPEHCEDDSPIWGAAIDIGTTTVTLWLVDLWTGVIHAQVAEYNAQIRRGEDVISRIIYADKDGGLQELQELVVGTINQLVEVACKRVKHYEVKPNDILKVTVAANTTMMHLFLGVPPSYIRLAPFIPTFSQAPILRAQEIGLKINPHAIVDCLPGVASYVGADITAGVLSAGMDDTDKLTLFLDVGTNGEMVLGSKEWLVTCACSAGPAFEGAGVRDGMRATDGAIEEVWINSETYEPDYRVIGGGKPRGICGSGLISLLAEMFMTGVIDKAGNLNANLPTPRIREGEHGMEYVVAWGSETQHGRDIVVTRVDIDNLLRAKAAIYAGFLVLAQSVGVPLEETEQVLIGGSFGKYLNIEKSIQIGLLPDLPWEKFHFLGNTAVKGAYYALLTHESRERIREIAAKMTYIELSADNAFYEAFMSAMFLPHTEILRFPSVMEAIRSLRTPQ
ncbi:MAG: ASKHA domain-containing protein [Anaerolineales bacterium]|nr:ASKHA domain-containing protein [Anaerolineales bacterium]MDW8160877.1 ASKHA domain-containing protein [Anaerolineales bacterium]